MPLWLNLKLLTWAVVVAIIVGLGAGWKLESNSHARTKQENLAIQVALKLEKETQVKNKKKADEENLRLKSDLATANKRMRQSVASRDFTGGAGSAETACYDRAKLDRAIREFASEVGALIERGASQELDLNTAKQWARD
jgi:hypothetical protein